MKCKTMTTVLTGWVLALTLTGCGTEPAASDHASERSATSPSSETPRSASRPADSDALTAGSSVPGPPTDADADAVRDQTLEAVITTNRGEVRVELLSKQAPRTVANFKNLADAEFYDGIEFHRVIPDFMIQGGDPTGSGRGGPGYKWPDEASALQLAHDRPGTLSMANAGPNTNGSQFFITHVATPHLDGKHAVFGRVTQGQDVVDAIGQGDTIQTLRVVETTAQAE